MKIIQVTDLHIGGSEELPFGIDVRTNFKTILDAVVKIQHDLLVITGDLCYDDGDRKVYRWIKDQLEQYRLNYVVLPGNHDDTEMMVEEFQLQSALQKGELFFTAPDEHPAYVMLNSGPGRLTSTCLELLTDFEVALHNTLIQIVANHYPFLKWLLL